ATLAYRRPTRSAEERAAQAAFALVGWNSYGPDWAAGTALEVLGEEEGAACSLLRCLFGNPFRPAVLEPGWPRWNDGMIVRRAQAIYDGREFDRLPVLADLLEEAGCRDVQLLGHLRGPGPHGGGCWAVDALLGKDKSARGAGGVGASRPVQPQGRG